MSTHPTPAESHTARLEQVLADYLHALEAGEPVDRDELQRKHPDLADELRSFFANRAALERLAEPLQGPAYDQTLGVADGGGSAHAGRVRYFGDYELLEEVARGGMGVVYKARQVSLNRIVAVKMILAGQFADESAVRRFRQEAEAAANLDHPHIVPVFEVGEHAGQQYFSMGFIAGQSLAEKLLAGPLSPREAAELMEKVARAVQYAHDKGVIHRDLKPANVLLDQEGRPRVTDFGLAKLSAREESLTETGQAIGTPGYMPPEQVEGKSAGPQSDVYGIGAILYALLTGRPPFQAATLIETLQQVRHSEPVPPRQLNPSVPRDLDTIVRKCLEKWPEWRYATAQELADELSRFLAGEAIHARRPGWAEQAVRWIGKQRRSVALAVGAVAATLVLTIVGMTGWLWYQDWRLGRLTLKTDRPPVIAELLNEHDELATPSFTVPTQEPVAVPADKYRLRVSQPGRFSQSYQVAIERGLFPAQFAFNLDDQMLAGADGSTKLRVDRDLAIVTQQGRANVVLLDSRGIQHSGWPSGGATWSVSLDKPAETELLSAFPGLRWPWARLDGYNTFEHLVLRPQVVRNAPDLDGDRLEDVIVAARHQAWVMAISGRDGKLLWFAGRGADVVAVDPRRQPPYSYSNRSPSAVLGTPLVVKDLDADDTPDLLASFADERGSTPASENIEPPLRRWLECLSGKSGETLWKYEYDPAWFALPAGVEIPREAQWMVEVTGQSGNGGSYSDDQGDVSRNLGGEQAAGEAHLAPYPPMLIEQEGRSLVVAVAGTRWITLNLASGRPAWQAVDMVLPAVRSPQAADLDGNGQAEVVVVQPLPDEPVSPNLTQVRPCLQVSAWPITTDSQPAWKHTIYAARHAPWKMSSHVADWPVIEDLDGDGQAEVILPTTSWDDRRLRPLKEIEVIDGASGRSRWRRMLKMMDPQIDDFLAGPDIDGDGHRDVFAATLYGNQYDLYVDALSGDDGQPLCWGSRRIGHPAFIHRVTWWHLPGDNWPHLLVHTTPEYPGERRSELLAFSARTGKFNGRAGEVDDFQLAACEDDGSPDLVMMQYERPDDPGSGGQLQVIRGVANERWRRMGGNWQAGSDYDGDGQADLIAIFPGGIPKIAAIAGADGRQLWQSELTSLGLTAWSPWSHPLSLDLDKDGTHDIVVHQGPDRSGAHAPRRQFPVVAVSGRTGARLWDLDITFSNIEGILFVAGRDLDRDDSPEIILSTFADWDYPRGGTVMSSSSWAQHWLAVIDGRTGQFRWRQPLSTAYGLPGAPANHGDETRQAQVRPAFADLDGDQVADIVMPAEIPDAPGKFELRACNGRDGQTLWQRPYSMGIDETSIWRDTVTPVASDLDGDGKPELVGLEYVNSQPANSGLQRHARILALAGATGQQLWSRDVAVDLQAGIAWDDGTRHDSRPSPLVLQRREDRPFIAFCSWSYYSDGKLIVLDHRGQPVTESTLPKDAANYFRTWAGDANGDGNDDLLFLQHDKLLAVEIRKSAERYETAHLWECPIPSGNPRRIVDLLPATDSHPMVIVVHSGTKLYGIASTTGLPVWTNAGPQPRSAAGAAVWTHAQLLSPPGGDEPPAATFQWADQFITYRTARRVGEPIRSWAVAAEGHSAIATRANSPDPRFVRKPPWMQDHSMQEVDRRQAAARIAWRLLLATFLLVLPARTLVTMTVQRRWTLMTWLGLPLLLGLMLTLFIVPVPSLVQPFGRDSARERWLHALFGTPLIVFAWLLVQHAKNLRWQRLLGWIVATLVVAALMVTVTIQIGVHKLGPGEHYVFADGWDIVLAHSFYITSWLSIIAVTWGVARRYGLSFFQRPSPLPPESRSDGRY